MRRENTFELNNGTCAAMIGLALNAFLFSAVNADQPSRNCRAVPKIEYDSAKMENLLRNRNGAYIERAGYGGASTGTVTTNSSSIRLAQKAQGRCAHGRLNSKHMIGFRRDHCETVFLFCTVLIPSNNRGTSRLDFLFCKNLE